MNSLVGKLRVKEVGNVFDGNVRVVGFGKVLGLYDFQENCEFCGD